MDSASCSGGTPFKRLIDHQSRDVSQHQDRLVHHSSQAQGGFRSTPQHAQAPQDGFGAFMDSPAMPMPMLQHDPAGRLAAHAAALQPARAPAFASPQELSQQPLPTPMASSNNWAADFTRFANQQGQPQNQRTIGASRQPHAATPMQTSFGYAFGPQQPINPGFSQFFAPAGAAYSAPGAAVATGEADFDQEMAQWMANNSGGNMEQVDAAMEQMARELELNDQLMGTENEDADALKGKSAVSEAAERLLESVQHESGEKWQNSVFLSLMRDFRDGRKDIVDNEIRQTDGETGESSET
ncbi:hypothetical protein VHEMI09746 [[Torrubiella] hemipterigena]|uniref:Peroxin 20 n=1 Tax=[Torrubiella] hemipterigena TaxID=1531966 RepID=A0A0A1TQY5_9HYPO|nr:hypothetical protein VHEMI09746 [[Torrubiella] hemipterigena]